MLKPGEVEKYLGGCCLCDCLHAPQHAESKLQVVRAEHGCQVGWQVLYMVTSDAADRAQVGRHLLHHVAVAQGSHLSHQ